MHLKYIALPILCSFCSIYGHAQNFVGNSGFESSEDPDKPDDPSQFEFCEFWEDDMFVNEVTNDHHHSPEYANSDGVHFNLTEGAMNNPVPIIAFEGDGYAGLARCELITTNLAQFASGGLEGNTNYYIGFYMRRLGGESSSVGFYNWLNNEAVLSVFLSENKPNYTTVDALDIDEPEYCEREEQVELAIMTEVINAAKYPVGEWYYLWTRFTTSSDIQNWLTFDLEELDLEDSDHQYILLDEIVIEEDCCPNHQLYENTDELPTETQREDYIAAGNDVGIPDIEGGVIVANEQTVSFIAGNEIILLPGFSVENGGEFLATIEDCNPTTQPEGEAVDLIAASSFIDKCLAPEYQIEQVGAEFYRITVHNLLGQLVFQDEGAVYSNFLDVWNVNPVASGWYNISLELWNCTEYDETSYSAVIFSSCKLANEDDKFANTNNDTEELPVTICSTYTLRISPNPANSTITLDSPQPISSAVFYNLLGSKLLEEQNTQNNSFNVSSLSQGVYLLKVFFTDQTVETARIVIQR